MLETKEDRFEKTKAILKKTLKMYRKYWEYTGEQPTQFIMARDTRNTIEEFIQRNIKLDANNNLIELWGIPIVGMVEKVGEWQPSVLIK